MNFANLWRKLRGQPRLTPAEAASTPTLEPLSDADSEFLFQQLLEGVAHGWDAARIEKFFERTGERADFGHWVYWLQRYAANTLSVPKSTDMALAERLERLAVQVQYTPEISEIGAAAYALASHLRARQTTGGVWEYDGPDCVWNDGTSEESLAASGQPGVETLTLEELLARLQADPGLRQQMAAQAGVESDDPAIIVQALVARLQSPET